jgi:hypothetical protein
MCQVKAGVAGIMCYMESRTCIMCQDHVYGTPGEKHDCVICNMNFLLNFKISKENRKMFLVKCGNPHCCRHMYV